MSWRFPTELPGSSVTLVDMEALIIAGGVIGLQVVAGLAAGLVIAFKVRRGPQAQTAYRSPVAKRI